MLIPHTFDQENHIYKVRGEYVLSTSDIISMNGMSEFGQVPPAALVHAGHRGTATHKAIEAQELGEDWAEAVAVYEEKEGVTLAEEVAERMQAYFRFRKGRSIHLASPMEQSRVYRHAGTEALIGTTVDMICFIDGQLTILDTKTCFKQYGAKGRQLKLKWWMQLQSYLEALEADDDLWKQVERPAEIDLKILHLHPKCLPFGFEVHKFSPDEFTWDAMIRVAMAKLQHGYKVEQPKTMEVRFGNQQYEAPADCEF
jgi:PD-(D/E)XK nuclease superfamily